MSWKGKESVFDFSKVDRAKLYGKRKRLVLDDQGKTCVKAELSEDGATIIKSGMTMQAYFDEQGEWVENRRLVGLDENDQPVDLVPSTLGKAQELEESSPEALAQNQMISVYHLSGVEPACNAELQSALHAGSIFRFPFNYRGDYACETAFLLSNDDGVFVLTTLDVTPEWCALETLVAEDFSDSGDFDDDLDFEMF